MRPARPTGQRPGQTREPTRSITIDDLGLTAALEGKVAGGKDLLFAWFQLFRTAQIHAIENQALQRPLHNFIDVTGRLLRREPSISFQSKDETLFFNSVKLKLSSNEYLEMAQPIFHFFGQRGMGGFVIDATMETEQVRDLLRILVYEPPLGMKFDLIQSALRDAGLPFRVNKQLGVRRKGGAAEVALERRSYAFLTYSKLVVLYRSLLSERHVSPARRDFLVKKIGRTVQTLVDVCLEDDHTFLGVSSVKSAAAYHPHHAANVAVLAISLGEKIGLKKVELADLGLAAVFSDIGLKETPSEILEKAGTLERDEQARLERHTHQSVEFLLEEKQYTKSVLRRILTAFEHHRRADGEGSPRLSHPPDLFSRIVAIADTYDALTSERPWRPAYLPDEALGLMVADAGQKLDPILLKVFVNSLGLYPIGTLVRLTSGELAVVVYGGGEGERLAHPVVARLGADGRLGESYDLMEKDREGRYLREIVSAEDPSKYGLQTSGLVAQGSPR